MEFFLGTDLDKRKGAEALVLPFWKGKKQGEEAFGSFPTLPSLSSVLETGDFKGGEGETLVFYLVGQPEKRILLLGLGDKEKESVEHLRRAYGALIKVCLNKKFSSLNLLVPHVPHLSEEMVIKGISEGALLANYQFDRYKSTLEDKQDKLVKKVTFFGIQPESLLIAKKAAVISSSVDLARELVNQNADEITPQYLVNCAKKLGKDFKQVKVTIFDKKRIEKENMGLLLAVNRGSALEPAFIILEYKGQPKSKDHTVLVGKGITYDTGGLNIKATGMEVMKCDMAGAATCLGILKAVAELQLKVNVTAVIPTTENCVDAHSFKPGDVYTSYSGATVEMMNSDAEGRLILADALAYAVENLKPTRLIDFATLTGAIEIALGSEATGLMSNEDHLAEALTRAGQETFERVWRMPLYEEYKDKLKSDIADLKSWNGRSASANVAATFLAHFVKHVPWAHLDIASTAYLSEPKKYLPKYATGAGIRLTVEFLENL